MMGLYRSIGGMLRIRILSGDVPHTLQAIDREKITVFSVLVKESVVLECSVHRRDISRIEKLCDRKGYQLQILKREGIFWPLRALITRPVFTVGMLLLLLTAGMIPGRILFISTEGNETVSSRCILEQAERAGLSFWSVRRQVRSEQIKNILLAEIPQLQWVGVNTYGCRAVITVRERSTRENDEKVTAVSHVVAARDGVVQSCTVTQGNKNCAPGKAVRKGDVLISGYTDCGLTIRAERAKGEVFALTKRSIRVSTPAKCRFQSQTGRTSTGFSLLIGKKRINFYKGSGIYGGSCDKMYSKYVLTLPGGFELPVALLKERAMFCDLTETETDGSEEFLSDFAADYLTCQMTEGSILRRTETLSKSEGVTSLTGIYDCLEQIGIAQDEMIGEFHGKTNGADR